MEVVIMRGSVIHDGVKRVVGEVLNMSDADGQRLIKLRVAVAAEEGGNTAPPASDPPPKEEVGNTEPKQPLDIDNMTRDDLAHELSVRGIRFKQTASAQQMADLLRGTIL